MKERLKDDYLLPIDSVCKHEFVFDGLADKSTGVTTLHVAKRLLDHGFHAPTIYFPLLFHESLMIEPTETESKETLDRFIEVMRSIAREAREEPETVKSAPRRHTRDTSGRYQRRAPPDSYLRRPHRHNLITLFPSNHPRTFSMTETFDYLIIGADRPATRPPPWPHGADWPPHWWNATWWEAPA